MPHFYTSDSILGLVNGAVVEFYGFSDSHLNMQLPGSENSIASPPAYMLVKLLNEVGVDVSLHR